MVVPGRFLANFGNAQNWWRQVNLRGGYEGHAYSYDGNSTVMVYDTEDMKWYSLLTTKDMGGEYQGIFKSERLVVYDPKRDLFWIYGGSTPRSDATWTYDAWRNIWKKRGSQIVFPETAYSGAAAYDTERDCIYHYGEGGGSKRREFWKLTSLDSSPTWSRVSGWGDTTLASDVNDSATSCSVSDATYAAVGGKIVIYCAAGSGEGEPYYITTSPLPTQRYSNFVERTITGVDGTTISWSGGLDFLNDTCASGSEVHLYPELWPSFSLGHGDYPRDWDTVHEPHGDYDSVNDKFIVFVNNSYTDTISTWAYNLDTNAWEDKTDLNPVPAEPRRSNDYATRYIHNKNAFALNLSGRSSTEVGRVVFYRYADGSVIDYPKNLSLTITSVPSITVAWDAVAGATGYYLYRGRRTVTANDADAYESSNDEYYDCDDKDQCDQIGLTWEEWDGNSWESSGKSLITGVVTLADTAVSNGNIYSYRVSAYDGATESRLSPAVRSVPKLILDGYVTINSSSSQTLNWTARETNGVKGYNIYQASVTVDRFDGSDCENVNGTKDGTCQNSYQYAANEYAIQDWYIGNGSVSWSKIATLETGTSYALALDLSGTPPDVYAFQVRAINNMNVEGGLGMPFYTIPSPPKRVNWTQEIVLGSSCGSRTANVVLEWLANSENVASYRVYRIKNANTAIERIATVSAPTRTYTDSGVVETNCNYMGYWITAIDSLGQEGIPSELVWPLRSESYWEDDGYLTNFNDLDYLDDVEPYSSMTGCSMIGVEVK